MDWNGVNPNDISKKSSEFFECAETETTYIVAVFWILHLKLRRSNTPTLKGA